jgi:hypothetical protein
MTSVILRNIARGRCCSFCYQQGHRINNCNDQRISEFETLCQNKKLEFEEEFNQIHEPEHIITNFRIWLAIQRNLNTSTYKAFAISRCGATLSDNHYIMLDKIIDYFNVPQVDYSNLPDLIEADDYNVVVPRQFPLISGLGNLDFIPFENNIRNMFNWHSIYTNQIFSQNLFSQNQNDYQLNITVEVSEEEVTTENIDKNLYVQNECSICYETKEHYEFVNLPCSHDFCEKCIIDTMKMCKTDHKNPFCGLCRAQFNLIKTRSEEIKSKIDNWLTPIITATDVDFELGEQEFRSWLSNPFTRQTENNNENRNANIVEDEEDARREELNEYILSGLDRQH